MANDPTLPDAASPDRYTDVEVSRDLVKRLGECAMGQGYSMEEIAVAALTLAALCYGAAEGSVDGFVRSAADLRGEVQLGRSGRAHFERWFGAARSRGAG